MVTGTGIKNGEKNHRENTIYYQSKPQEEFITLLYNDIFKNFITDWNKISSNRNICENKEPASLIIKKGKIIDKEFVENISEEEMLDFENNSQEKEDEKCSFQKDKFEITFPNRNSYSGQINRNKIEGIGSYFWRHGAQYKGEFKENQIQGKGHLIWKDNSSWYEGEFLNSMRHGKGTMVNKDFSRFYTGNWYMGQKNGNGLCRYADDNFYDGSWVMGKKQGMGYRVYPNGSVYVGNWENDFRHGIGTMVWPHGDIYRGKWVFGQMHGYGEYTWNGYFNKTLSWPQENSYMGQWIRGLRHGKGLLKLNSVGGAKYSGMWNEDEKHGYGVLIGFRLKKKKYKVGYYFDFEIINCIISNIIGNNGSAIEMNPPFQNDIIMPENIENNGLEENSANKDETSFIKEPRRILDSVETNYLNPEQWPLLPHFLRHLAIKSKKDIGDSIKEVQRCKKCNLEGKDFCDCFTDFLQKEVTQISSVDEIIDYNTKLREKLLTQEELSLRNSLTTQIPRLRKIYDIYTKVFCLNEKVSPYLSMSRLSLWQLWRDCGIHKKNISLIKIDNLIAASIPKTVVETEHGPFERIEIWQFLFALLELSWKLYSKFENSDYSGNRLAGGFSKLLEFDIFPNAGKHSGKIFDFKIHFLPLYSVYRIYRDIGEPHSVKKLLRTICNSKDSPIQNRKSSISIQIFEGKNVNSVGERITFIPNPEPLINSTSQNFSKESSKSLNISVFRELGAAQLLSIIALICPSIKNEELNTNINYELTFLEFYEILLEGTVALIKKRKVKDRKKLQLIQIQKLKEEIELETLSITSLSTKVQSHASISTKKEEKPKKKKPK